MVRSLRGHVSVFLAGFDHAILLVQTGDLCRGGASRQPAVWQQTFGAVDGENQMGHLGDSPSLSPQQHGYRMVPPSYKLVYDAH